MVVSYSFWLHSVSQFIEHAFLLLLRAEESLGFRFSQYYSGHQYFVLLIMFPLGNWWEKGEYICIILQSFPRKFLFVAKIDKCYFFSLSFILHVFIPFSVYMTIRRQLSGSREGLRKKFVCIQIEILPSRNIILIHFIL